jgi:hypothetical protein
MSHADPAKTATAVVTVAEDLIDQGGPVAPDTRTFAVWWGDSKSFPSDARTGLDRMLRGLDGSAYLAITDQYMRGRRATTSFAGNLFDSSAPPADPTWVMLADYTCRILDANGIAPREGDLVFLITSNFPQAAQGVYCGLHGSATCHGQSVLLAFTPNPTGSWCDTGTDNCKSGLSAPTFGLLMIGAHELIESITDPFGTAWRGHNFFEIVDRCGSPACVPLSTGTFQLPQLYSNAKHTCVAQ